MSDPITRPALRYHGGKFTVAPWIIRHFPPHTVYCEPFAGAASVLLRKPPSLVEVLNDRFEDVVTFFRVLRDRPADLIRVLELTPYARQALLEACEPAEGNELERARRFAVVAGQSRSGAGTRNAGGWRHQGTPLPGRTSTFATQWADTAHLWHVADRLRNVQIECDDALAIIRRYDSPQALFYVDPPYLPATRGTTRGTGAYHCDYTEADHRRLADVLATLRGSAILSAYESDLYYDLYPTWTVITRTGRTKNNARRPTECLWISPNARLGHEPVQLSGRHLPIRPDVGSNNEENPPSPRGRGAGGEGEETAP